MEDSWRQNNLIKKVQQRQMPTSSSSSLRSDEQEEEQRLEREKWALKKKVNNELYCRLFLFVF